MNDLILAFNAELAGLGECTGISRLQEPDGASHCVAHLHLAATGPRLHPHHVADLMAARGCHDITVAHVLHDTVNGIRSGYTQAGGRHWTVTFRRADERTRAQTARVLRFLGSPRGAQVDHISLANMIELAGIAPEDHRMQLLEALHSALAQAGWARYLGASTKGRPRAWLYKRPLPAALHRAAG